MRRIIRVAAPAVGAGVDAVEEAVLGIGDGEIQAEQLGAFAQVDDAAVRGKIAADVGHPAVAEIEAAGDPLLGGGRGRSGLLISLRRRRGRLGRLRLLVRLRGRRLAVCLTVAPLAWPAPPALAQTPQSKSGMPVGISFEQVPVHIGTMHLLVAERAVLEPRAAQIVQCRRHRAQRAVGGGVGTGRLEWHSRQT